MSLAYRVANGVRMLDEKVPGWWRVINLERLSMGDCTNCMLGQLFGYDIETALGSTIFGLGDGSRSYGSGYIRGLKALNATAGTIIGCNADSTGEFQDLKCLWADVIAERRAAADVGSN